MSRVSFRTLWTLDVVHAFYGGATDALAFVVPPSTERALAGAHAMVRERDGRLFVLAEVNEGGQLLSPLVGMSFVFGLRPRAASFELVTVPTGLAAGDTATWDNAVDPNQLAGPRAVRVMGEQLRLEPRSSARPLAMRLFDAANTLVAQATLNPGDESWTPRGLFPRGEWRVEEQGAGPASSWTLRVEPELIGIWGLVSLRVDAAHIASGQAFTLNFQARSDTLRYYVVATRYGPDEFDQVQVVDSGFGAEARPQIQFQRVLPAAFGASHLSPQLLDPTGSARIALFEAQAAVTRRARGPGGVALHRNGDVLIGNLPQPGAERYDAQFVVHLSLP